MVLLLKTKLVKIGILTIMFSGACIARMLKVCLPDDNDKKV